MAKYQKYAEYKDSGVEWLGAIPGHWGVTQLKRLGKFITGMTPSTAVEAYYSDEITEYGWIRPEDILEESEKVEPTKFLTKLGWETQRTIPAQSTLICCIGTIGKLGFLGKRAVTNQQITALVPDVRGFSKYYYYLLTASRNQLEHLATGNVVKILNSERLGSLWLPLLSSQNEARQIVHFLDYETAKIDHLIEKQQQLIELLKEKRQAVISHAVTKGLNPNVPMKDSGVEWLGEVPEHWGILPIKYLTESVYTGGTPKNPISFTDVDEVNWFTPGDFLNDLEITASSKYVTFDSVNTGDSKLYPRGSVLMIGIGATLGKIAICNTEFSCNQQINVLVPNRSIISEYLAYALIIQMDQIKQLSNSSTIGIINQEKTKQIVIALPALDEQVKIVEKITQKLLGFKKIIDLSEEQVELLKERRTALISAAVTGKIDVRNWQAPNVAEADTEFSA